MLGELAERRPSAGDESLRSRSGKPDHCNWAPPEARRTPGLGPRYAAGRGRSNRCDPGPREINVEVDDAERAAVEKSVEAALGGAADVLWLTDKRGRRIAVPAEKIAYVEIGTADGDRRIGFGG